MNRFYCIFTLFVLVTGVLILNSGCSSSEKEPPAALELYATTDTGLLKWTESDGLMAWKSSVVPIEDSVLPYDITLGDDFIFWRILNRHIVERTSFDDSDAVLSFGLNVPDEFNLPLSGDIGFDEELYWIVQGEGSAIMRLDADGENASVLKFCSLGIKGCDFVITIADQMLVDENRLLVSAAFHQMILLVDLDTEKVVPVVEEIQEPTDENTSLFIDSIAVYEDVVFWTASNMSGVFSASISNGLHREVIGTEGAVPRRLKIKGGHLYWIDDDRDALRYTDLAGTDVKTLFTGTKQIKDWDFR